MERRCAGFARSVHDVTLASLDCLINLSATPAQEAARDVHAVRSARREIVVGQREPAAIEVDPVVAAEMR
jgi:hypothetical protein